ncbi:MAG: polysaccharide pyruvyl transferase family protein, partial [Clostridia bacterium]
MKIAILSFYYNNKNYGGLLQSFATNTFLNKGNLKIAEMLSYDFIRDNSFQIYKRKTFFQKIKGETFSSALKKILKRTNKYLVKFKKRNFRFDFSNRENAYQFFENRIPHTINKYTTNGIEKINSDYNAYIVGSDQVWNPYIFRKPFFFTFASDKKLKIAYAASMGVSEISDEVANKIIPLIERFDYVSVREKSAKDLINRYTDKEVTVVSDPVLLLNQDDWNEVAVSPISDKS